MVTGKNVVLHKALSWSIVGSVKHTILVRFWRWQRVCRGGIFNDRHLLEDFKSRE